MKPPKRSPFLHSRQTDLLEVYRHLYPDSPFLPSNTSSAMDRHRALSIVQLWINRSACPFAVETTALLVQSVILDDHMQQVAASSLNGTAASLRSALEQMDGGAELGVRLNYSLALTRFVNSVVDSHQTGGFAQSIAAIAARIGLPLWFVEIRHAVTHEELPSIAVCRQAAGAALSWLHRHFWIPQLFEGPQALNLGTAQGTNDMDLDQPGGEASTSAADLQASGEQEQTRRKERGKALTDLRATLKAYRALAKQVSRDRSLANTSKDAFRRLYKQFAVFVSKMRTLEPDFGAQLIDRAAGSKKGRDEEADVRTTAVLDPDQVDECTKSALADLVNQLLQPGWMVPLSVAKRVKGKASGDDIVLPAEVASIWSPLLGYLRDTYGAVFGQILAEELVDVVVREMPSEDEASPEEREPTSDELNDPSYEGWKNTAYASTSYRKTAEAWLRYLVSSIPPSSHASANNLPSTRPPTTLIGESDLAEICLRYRSPACTALLEYLCERNAQLKARIAPLLAVLKVSAFVEQVELELGAEMNSDSSGFEAHLEIMEQRRKKMEHVQWSYASQTNESSAQDGQASVDASANASAGASDSASAGAGVTEGQSGAKMPKGWSLAPPEWKPTPFGCLNGQIPDLVLEI